MVNFDAIVSLVIWQYKQLTKEQGQNFLIACLLSCVLCQTDICFADLSETTNDNADQNFV